LPNSFLPRKSPEEWRKKSTSFEGWVRGMATNMLCHYGLALA